MSVRRLSRREDVAAGIAKPAFDPSRHGAGIVHLGVGAFHKAHQAVYTDAAIAAEGGDWRIVGVSLRGTAAAAALNPQDGLYSLIVRGEEGVSARLIGSLARVIAAVRDPVAALDALCDPAIRIVSLTVTEKAYGIDSIAGAIDLAHPAIAADLQTPRAPAGVLGLIVESLRRRKGKGVEPFTVLCCDNLPRNGLLVRSGVLDFARRAAPELVDWIAGNVAFPATMVDRITPAPTERTLDEARRLTGVEDLAAVETEPFSQWVIEDTFVNGRPAWEAGGALFVADVAPYEQMKLRMLNGAHSMLAYAGFLSGHALVRDVMADLELARLVARHISAAAATLAPLQGIDFARYGAELEARFRNPFIAHETYQIAMDGTLKLPQRLLQPAEAALRMGQDPRPFAFALAAWMRYCCGTTDKGEAYALRDPREAEIRSALEGACQGVEISDRLHALPNLIGLALSRNSHWRNEVASALDAMLRLGVPAAARAAIAA
ncbi:MAG: mannitol dehydrogenase family protein [Albidovulum sp.]|nr:mannitol dehydrogenase family protein [Albidovulum sp.]